MLYIVYAYSHTLIVSVLFLRPGTFVNQEKLVRNQNASSRIQTLHHAFIETCNSNSETT